MTRAKNQRSPWSPFLALAGFGALALSSTPAHACKCMLQSVEQAREQASAIFEGRVTRIEDVPSAADPQRLQKRVTFALVRVWKDLENAETVSLVTSDSTASCGYPFEQDQSYLVYAGNSEQGLGTGSCSRTRKMSEASEDLAALGGGITPVKVEPAAPPAKTEEPKPKPPRAGGCASTRGQSRSAAVWFGLPVVGMVLRRRRAAPSPLGRGTGRGSL